MCTIPLKYKEGVLQEELQLSEEEVLEYKEVFQLFDKDEDGVLSFSELSNAINTLGHRHSGIP